MASPSPSNRIERGHQMYREGRYDEALELYTEALALARTMPHKIVLHSNRAACFLKLHLFSKAVEECTSVLELDHNHTGALMLRAQTLVTLKDYHSALFDVNRLIDLDPSSEVYQNLHARLKTQLSLAPIPESEAELEEEEENDEVGSCNLGVRAQETISSKNMETASIKHDRSADSIKGNAVKCHGIDECSELQVGCRNMQDRAPEVTTCQEEGIISSNGWQTIPKPKGHATLDYARWDKVVDDESSEDDDDDDEEECQPQYRFRVRTVGVRPVK